MSAMAEAVSDTATITRRNLKKILRVPDVLVFTLLSPIMFVLLFAYVFGTAIGDQGTGVDYREFLVPGIFAQTVVFGSTFTGYSLSEDLQKGIIDRFRSLPMSPRRWFGRTLADVGINVLSLIGDGADRAADRLADPVLDPRGGGRVPAAAPVRLRHLLDHGLRRTVGARARGVQQRRVHRDLPADVRREHVRHPREPARTRWRPSRSGTRSPR